MEKGQSSIHQKEIATGLVSNEQGGEKWSCHTHPRLAGQICPTPFFHPTTYSRAGGKKDRQIFNAAQRYNKDAIPVNMMTTTNQGTELDCEFGDVKTRLLTRVYNLRITYPDDDVIIHANDVKSCFRQLKHHPDVMGAFSHLIVHFLFLQCGQTFGSDFSPASWEVCHHILEQLSTSLFDDKTL